MSKTIKKQASAELRKAKIQRKKLYNQLHKETDELENAIEQWLQSKDLAYLQRKS